MEKAEYELLKSKYYGIFARVPAPLRDEIIAVIDDEPYTWRTANVEIERGNKKKAEALLKQLKKMGLFQND